MLIKGNERNAKQQKAVYSGRWLLDKLGMFRMRRSKRRKF
jgi:hypothetical protein